MGIAHPEPGTKARLRRPRRRPPALPAAARRLLVLIALTIAGLGAGAGPVAAAELLMFEDPACAWCRRWHAEIGPGYPHSAEGQLAPLRRVHIRDQATAGVALAGPVRATPTFVLAEDGREIGRIVGYPGADFFYPRLAELLAELAARAAPPPVRRPVQRSTMCLAACR